jgi:RimJ/RimL family protein N-acetyltransferase
MLPLEDVIAYLKSDPLKYVVHLKMLAAFAARMRWHGSREGYALLLPTRVFPYDARTYPDVEWVVLLAADSGEAADQLIGQLPRGERLVFKLVDELTREAVLRALPARRVTSFVSFTAQGGDFPLDPAVAVSARLDERLLPCFQSNGYTQPELEQYFSQGSLSFSLFAGDEPLSTCLIFKNYERIWEIGGVYTRPDQRRRGLARQVVAAALHELLAWDLIPRYQVKESNTASIRLAEALGLRRFVTTEHYLYTPE